MKDTLKQAVKSGDIRQIRAIMIDSMTCGAGNTATLNQITEAIEKVPGLFDRDDGKFYAASARDMTETLIVSLREDLGSNFSLPKYRLYTEVQALMVSNPDYYSDKQEETGEPIANPGGSPEPSGMIRKAGYFVMAAGAVAVTVAICVPVRFLIGIGIGVIMLGSAMVYANISR